MAKKKPPATAQLEQKLTQAQAACRGCLPQVEFFEQMAEAMPEIADDVGALRLKWEHLNRLTEIGLNGLDVNT